MFSWEIILHHLCINHLVYIISNIYVLVKGVWLQESNKELRDFIHSKSHYINFSGSNVRTPSNEAIQSLYSMTKVLDQDKDKLTNPVF